MNNSELEKTLRSAAAPERTPEYWEQFPKRTLVTALSRLGGATAARDRDAAKTRERWSWAAVLRPGWALPAVGWGAACVFAAPLMWPRPPRPQPSALTPAHAHGE